MRAQWLRCRLRVADLSGFGGAAATVASSSTPPNVSAAPPQCAAAPGADIFGRRRVTAPFKASLTPATALLTPAMYGLGAAVERLCGKSGKA